MSSSCARSPSDSEKRVREKRTVRDKTPVAERAPFPCVGACGGRCAGGAVVSVLVEKAGVFTIPGHCMPATGLGHVSCSARSQSCTMTVLPAFPVAAEEEQLFFLA